MIYFSYSLTTICASMLLFQVGVVEYRILFSIFIAVAFNSHCFHFFPLRILEIIYSFRSRSPSWAGFLFWLLFHVILVREWAALSGKSKSWQTNSIGIYFQSIYSKCYPLFWWAYNDPFGLTVLEAFHPVATPTERYSPLRNRPTIADRHIYFSFLHPLCRSAILPFLTSWYSVNSEDEAYLETKDVKISGIVYK